MLKPIDHSEHLSKVIRFDRLTSQSEATALQSKTLKYSMFESKAVKCKSEAVKYSIWNADSDICIREAMKCITKTLVVICVKHSAFAELLHKKHHDVFFQTMELLFTV